MCDAPCCSTAQEQEAEDELLDDAKQWKDWADAVFPSGLVVCLHGLEVNSDLEGQVGRIKGFTGRRYRVELFETLVTTCCDRLRYLPTCARLVEVKGQNLRMLPTGTVCTVEGLEKQPELNRKQCVVLSFLSSGRYKLVLKHEPARMISVSSNNIRPLRPADGSNQACWYAHCSWYVHANRSSSSNAKQKKRKRPAEWSDDSEARRTQAASAAIATHEAAWVRFSSWAQKTPFGAADVPWPPSRELLEGQLRAGRDGKDPEVLRRLRRRWHPDKFQQAYRDCMREGEAAVIVKRVTEIAAIVNEFLHSH